MGQSESTPQDVDYSKVPTLGYRVLGVQPNSPASDAGLVSFFDFLVGANGRMLFNSVSSNEKDDNDDVGEEEEEEEEGELGDVDFVELLQNNVGRPIELLVFNIKSQETRLCYMTPSKSWGGAGLLGVTIRVDSYAHAEDNLLRVLEVEDNSPAQMAGLQTESDYLLGTKSSTFSSMGVLFQVLLHNKDKVLEIYVYNKESDVVRVVNIMATYSWGGRGLLGAQVGSGYLHQIPKIRRNTTGSSLQKDGTINPSKGTTIILSHSNNKNKVDAIIYRNEEDMSQTKSSIEVSPSPTIIPDVQDVQQIPTNQMQVDAAAPETQVEEPATEQDQREPEITNENIDMQTDSNPVPTSASEENPEDGVHPESESRPEEELPPQQEYSDQPIESIPPGEETEDGIIVHRHIPPPSTETISSTPSQVMAPPPLSTNGTLPPPPISGTPVTAEANEPTPNVSSGGLFSSFFPPPPFFSRNVVSDSDGD